MLLKIDSMYSSLRKSTWKWSLVKRWKKSGMIKIIRGIFITLWNTWYGMFCKNTQWLNTINSFWKKLLKIFLRCSTGFWIDLWLSRRFFFYYLLRLPLKIFREFCWLDKYFTIASRPEIFLLGAIKLYLKPSGLHNDEQESLLLSCSGFFIDLGKSSQLGRLFLLVTMIK